MERTKLEARVKKILLTVKSAYKAHEAIEKLIGIQDEKGLKVSDNFQQRLRQAVLNVELNGVTEKIVITAPLTKQNSLFLAQ